MTIRQLHYILLATAFVVAISGCGSSNDKAPALTATGKHPGNWYTAHRQAYSLAYLQDGALQCRDCHGIDLMGGITRIDCFQGIPGGSCHANGHGPRPIPHAIPFLDPAAHGPAAKADLVSCQICHGQGGGPGSNPRFNVPIGSLAQGCTASGCHNINSPTHFRYTSAAHPIPWSGHNSAGNILNSCGLCHGQDLFGGVGQSCQNCHTSMTAGVPPVYGQCITCHAKPPASGAHLAHNAVASMANLCTACHSGAGSGTARHSLRSFANVSTAIPAEFNARSGPGIVTASLTCQNISCHGGVTTPPWIGGTIDVTAQCTLCHLAGSAAQTPQYNSYFSGEHTKHVQVGVPCFDCHDMNITSGTNSHFGAMGTPAFELNPSLTIRSQVNYVGGSCSPGVTPPPGVFQFTNCHATEPW